MKKNHEEFYEDFSNLLEKHGVDFRLRLERVYDFWVPRADIWFPDGSKLDLETDYRMKRDG